MFRINVKTIKGHILTFKGVSSYKVIDGFLTFTDVKTGAIKRFSTQNTEVEEE